MTRDPFSVLEIPDSATEDEIKSAYRKLAKKYHPDLNPGDKAAEQKMKEVNDAYAEAMRIRKNGGTWQSSSSSNSYGGSYHSTYGSSYSGSTSGYGGYGSNPFWGQKQGWEQQRENPFEEFGFGFSPFSDFFGAGQHRTTFRTRNYADPELKTVESHVLAQRFQDALNLLNRIPTHDADWHALYARADLGLGNRISALDHARKASQMAPEDSDYQQLVQVVESGRQAYQQTRQTGYQFKNAVCANPFLTCCAMNVALRCCLGGRVWLCC